MSHELRKQIGNEHGVRKHLKRQKVRAQKQISLSKTTMLSHMPNITYWHETSHLIRPGAWKQGFEILGQDGQWYTFCSESFGCKQGRRQVHKLPKKQVAEDPTWIHNFHCDVGGPEPQSQTLWDLRRQYETTTFWRQIPDPEAATHKRVSLCRRKTKPKHRCLFSKRFAA